MMPEVGATMSADNKWSQNWISYAHQHWVVPELGLRMSANNLSDARTGSKH